jgi:hypothetical protein
LLAGLSSIVSASSKAVPGKASCGGEAQDIVGEGRGIPQEDVRWQTYETGDEEKKLLGRGCES